MTPHPSTPGAGDVLDRLRAARPVTDADVERLLDERGDAVLARVMAGPGAIAPVDGRAAADGDELARWARRQDRRAAVVALTGPGRALRRRARVVVPAGIAAAVAVVLLVAGQDGGGTSSEPSGVIVAGDRRGAASAPAGAALIALASAARAAPTGTGTVAYTATTEAYRTDLSSAVLTVASSSRRLWKAPDGSGRLDEAVYHAERSSPPDLRHDVETWGPGGSPDGGSWRAGVIRDRAVADLPSTPDALAAAVRTWAEGAPRMVGGDVPGTVTDNELDLLTSLLSEPAATPAQRAAAFEVLAARDDVGLLGRHADPLGRAGTAVEYEWRSSGTNRATLTFDPTTSALLSREDALVDTRDEWPAGTAVGPWSWTAWTASAVVDAVGDLPAAPPTVG